MALLTSIFSAGKKKNQQRNTNNDDNEYVAVVADSPATRYPNSPSGAPSLYPSYAASSSKLRLPFRSSKSSTAPSLPRTSTSADSVYDALPPPPTLGQHTQSTRSLPNQTQKSSRSLFFWNKNASKSNLSSTTPSPAPSPARPPPQPTTHPDDSFNLKSFRHLSPTSPSYSSSQTSLPSPRPPARPRGDSIASDSSQRISVAAFREAQARRSLAGSPVPSFTSPSPRSNTPPVPRPAPRLQQPQPPRRSTVPLKSSYDDDDDEDDTDSDSGSSSSEGAPRQKPLGRRRTITQRSTSQPALVSAKQSRSEAGHGFLQPPRTSTHQRAQGNENRSTRAPNFPARKQTNDSSSSSAASPTATQGSSGLLGMSSSIRSRASLSTSALSQTPAAKRASIIAAQSNQGQQTPNTRAHVRNSSYSTISARPTAASSSSDDSDDDAPLSSLVPPRSFNGSQTSLASSGRSPIERKPLIDINSVTNFKPGSNMSLPAPNAGLTSKVPPGPKRFASPKTSPVRSEFGSAAAAPTTTTTSESRSPTQQAGAAAAPTRSPRPRETLFDRLNKVTQESPKDDKLADGKSQSRSPVLRHRRSHSDHTLHHVKRDSTASTLLGIGIKTDYSAPISTSSNGDRENKQQQQQEENTGKQDGVAPPVPIKTRAPPSAFTVTSRPQNSRPAPEGFSSRQRSSTVAAPLVSFDSPPSFSQDSVPSTCKDTTNHVVGRPRSSTLLKDFSSELRSLASEPPKPAKPFADSRSRDSPASSSSGRTPLTPRDGSEISVEVLSNGSSVSGMARNKEKKKEWSGGISGLGLNGLKKSHRKSISFDTQMTLNTPLRDSPSDEDSKRRERRRSEAKAAIEFGNVINGRGPVLTDDDEDEDVPINQISRKPMANPMLGFNPSLQPNFSQSQWNLQATNMWPPQPGFNTPHLTGPPQFLSPNTADPAFMAAHQQALMYAKQAYQMAVAQQAMLAAGEEWERGSTVGGGFGGGGSVYGGGGSVYGGGGGGSVYGGGGGSVYGGSAMSAMNMGGAGWQRGSFAFPSAQSSYGGMTSARSEYGGGGARSEYGGGGGGGRWDTQSVFGESFGHVSNRQSRNMSNAPRPPSQRVESGYFAGQIPPLPTSSSSSSKMANARTRAESGPALRTSKKPPPSSWKTKSP